MSPLGRFIIRARERRGWTRAALHRAADVPYTTLRNVEKSESLVQPSEIFLKAIADALGEDLQERHDYFEQLRVLAGYMVVVSQDVGEQNRRFLASVDAYPHLRRALEELLRRGDSAMIDRAYTAIEVARRLEEPQ